MTPRTPSQRERRREHILDTYAKIGTIRGTTRKLGISIHVVRRVLRGEDGPRQPPRSRPPRASKLDAFKPNIKRLVLEDGLSGVLVLEEIRALGYEGGYSILTDYIRRIRPAPTRRATTRLEHPPGAEGQVDWSPYTVRMGGELVDVHAFGFTLPFSRWTYLQFRLDEKLETLIELHEEAFRELDGVPMLMTYDNMTTVGRHVGPGEIRLNPRFDAWRKDYGFDVSLIAPGKPNEHAPVERNFHFIENNCLRRRRFCFDDLDDLNRHALWWCRNVANVRVHGTTRERPIDRLERERLYLLTLPWKRGPTRRTLSRDVQSDFCVAVDTNRYSVSPKLVGRPATVYVYNDSLEILVDGRLAARHELCCDRYKRRVLPEHEEELKRATPSRRALEQAFIRLGPAAHSYYDGLRAQRGRGAGYHLQRILKLADRHGSEAVCGAMSHAARYGNYSADAIARVLHGQELRRRSPRARDEHAPPPSERVRRWLEGIHVEDSDLADYDRAIDAHTDDDNTVEGEDGER